MCKEMYCTEEYVMSKCDKSDVHEFDVRNHFVRRFYLFTLRVGLLEREGRRVR